MTITDIIRGQKNKRRYNVFLDGEYSFAVYDDTLLEFRLKKGTPLSHSEIEEITAFDRKKRAYEKALDLLSRRDFSQKGMVKKLIEKGIEEEDAEQAAEELTSSGYINDRNFAEEYAKYCSDVKGLGKRRIIFELMSKGIDKETAEEVTGELDSFDETIITELKKALKNKDISDQKEKRRAFDRLVRKGYDYDSIKSAMTRLETGEEIN